MEAKNLHADNPDAKDFIDRAFARSKAPRDEFLIIPRVMIRHPLNNKETENRVVWSYSPQQIMTGLNAAGKLKGLFAEIPDAGVRAQLLQMLEESNKRTASKPLAPSFDLAKKIITDGLLHEISRMVWFYGEDRLLVFTQEHLRTNGSYSVRSINASLLIPFS